MARLRSVEDSIILHHKSNIKAPSEWLYIHGALTMWGSIMHRRAFTLTLTLILLAMYITTCEQANSAYFNYCGCSIVYSEVSNTTFNIDGIINDFHLKFEVPIEVDKPTNHLLLGIQCNQR